MNLSVKIKLLPDSAQKQSLLATFEAFNAAANHAAKVGFDDKTFSVPSIQKKCYYDIRKQYGLTAQLAVRSIGKAAECFKRDKKVCPVFKPRSAVVYDQRIMSFKGLTHVSLASVDGRLKIPMVIAGYQNSKLQEAIKTGQADLVYANKTFFLIVSITVDDVKPQNATRVLGVDLGVNNIAVDSEGNTYTGDEVEAKRKQFQNRRSTLQSVGTRSAKRRLKSNSKKESNYRRTLNHQISRRIVDTAKALGASIQLENLKGIRDRIEKRFRKNQRAKISGWSFHQLRSFIEYKAELAGVVVDLINPRNTSRTCPSCGHCDKANRKTQESFECVDCGFSEHADFVAAINIAAAPAL